MGLGRDTATATALWIRTVDLHLSDRATPAQVAAAIRTIGVLDPTWVEPWFFGVLMLPPEAHGLRLELVEQAAQLHPDVPWFAWRAGMDRLGEDRPAALDWLRQAASAPGADPAYAELLRAIEERPR